MLQKILLLVGVLAIVWYGFKYVGRLTQQRDRKIAEKEERARKGISDTVQCPVCDAYIAEDLKSDCGKVGCPY